MQASSASLAQPAARNATPRLRRGLKLALPALLLLALALYGPAAWNRYQDARLRRLSLPELERAVRQRPADVNTRYYLGLAYARASRYPEATREFLAVLDKEPVRPDVLNDLGVSYLFEQRFYESLIALQGALTARPDYAPAYANLGRLHLATKMPFTAVRELEKAAQLDPGNVTVLCDLGEAYQQTLNLKGAQTSYERAIQRDSRYVPAHIGLGKTLFSLGQYDRAEQALDAALKMAPENPIALLTLGRLHMDRAAGPAELQTTQQLFERAVKLEPDDPEGWYDLGRVQLRQGRAAEAVNLLAHALRLSPQHQGALHELERALRAAGRTAEADRVGREFQTRALREREETRLEEYIAHSPTDWEAHVRLARSYIESGNRGMALLLARQVQSNAPNTPSLPALLNALNQNAKQ